MHFGGKLRRVIVGASAVAALTVAGLTGFTPAPSALAANAADFDPGNIIDDGVFYNPGTMSPGQIQDFLNSKVSRCSSGYTCLKDYSTATTTRAAVANRCSGYAGAASESAATIIWKVAQSCGINPQVLIVLLQKEQGLVTSTAPSATRYRSATGYGCPDTAPCDSLYYGFYNQVYMAAYQFKIYRGSPGSFAHQAGRVNAILFNPNAACGRSSVFIANQATAGLYNYTPYTPNSAALANMYGTGDACSSYGNRNFFAYFSDWFGPPTANAFSPFGSLDVASTGLGFVRVAGWAIDPDTTDPLSVHVYVDGVGTALTTASGSRPDVGAAYPSFGSAHGFSLDVDIAPGSHNVCVYAINVGAGLRNATLGCQTLSVPSASPVGGLGSVAAVPGAGIRITGWAADPESASPIVVRAYVDGGTYLGEATASASTGSVPADLTRTVGASHGFDATFPATAGLRNVCVYAINTGRGDNVMLGCGSVNYLSGSPVGSLDSVQTGPGSVTIQGWTLDPDSTASVRSRIIVDGTAVSTVTADGARPDIAEAYPGYGAAHGFSTTVQLTGGAHTVCVQTINTGAGSDSTLPCSKVTIASGSPIGSVDRVEFGPGSVTVSGWALDYDTAASIPVHVYVDSGGVAGTASGERPDIAAAFTGWGSAHGFSITVPTGGGSHRLCVYALNSGAGGTSLLTCRTIAVPTGAPIGSWDMSTSTSSSVRLRGWALDYDTSASIMTHVYIDGAWAGSYSASARREDLATAFPGWGGDHGFDIIASATSGSHNVCVWAIDSGGGSSTLLGCRMVAVG